MKRRGRIGWAMVVLAGVGTAVAKPAKPPKNAPYCAVTGTRPLFVAPMGQLYRGEPGQPYPAAAWIRQADRNGDGVVDRTEMVADADRFFKQLDKDGDGRLSPDEVGAYEHMIAPETGLYAGRREVEGPRRGGSIFSSGSSEAASYSGPIGAGRFAWLNIPEPVAAADTDVDRIVTETEFTQAASRRFDALDTRNKGGLSLADLPRTPQQIAIEGPCRPRPVPRRKRPGDEWDEPDPARGQEQAPR